MVAPKISLLIVAVTLGSAFTAYAAPTSNYGGDNSLSRREIADDQDDGLFARGFYDELEVRGFEDDEELAARGFDDDELEAREFYDDLEARDFDDELEARAFYDDELEARDFYDDLEARGFDDEELEAREFDDELDARDLDSLDGVSLSRRGIPKDFL
ncbi:hypothetical protein AX15_005920, partial [Amanita polypyramis BW_CC]